MMSIILQFQQYARILSVVGLFLCVWSTHAQKRIRYDLYVADTLVNYTGKSRKAIAINGLIPGPTLYFTEGDTAEIYVHNRMHHETSILGTVYFCPMNKMECRI